MLFAKQLDHWSTENMLETYLGLNIYNIININYKI